MKKVLFLFATLALCVSLSAQTTYFVSNSGDDSNNGLSWATAKATINGAMALITAPNHDSVFVAVGTYPACTVKNSTHVYGGFAGTESHLSERQPLTYGIAADSSCSVIDAQHNSNYAVKINGYMYSNNTYYCWNTDFDGFYVTGGNQYGVCSEANSIYTIANSTMTDNACGLYLGMSYSNSYYNATFHVSDCKIYGNTTYSGVYMYSNSQTYGATFEFNRCLITENTGNVSGGMRFNAAYLSPFNTIIVNDCDITKNVATGLTAKAGGILTQGNNFTYNQSRSEWRIINSRIVDNIVYTTATTASDEDHRPYIAGGVSIYTHSTHIIGSVIANNSAISTEGINVTGGVVTYANGTTSPSSAAGNPVGRLYMTNCVVANNLAQTSSTGGIGGIRTTKAATVKNMVAINNKCGSVNKNLNWSTDFTLPYSYCACQATLTSDFAADSTNVVLDSVTVPMFVSPSSMIGATTIASDFSNLNADWHVMPGSPLIDAGDPNTAFITYLPDTDMDGNPRIGNNIADIGAYEYSNTTFNQTINWNQDLTASIADGTLTLTATATSGLPVTYTSSNPSIATVNGNVLTLHTPGYAIITASQPGNATWNAAADVSKILTVTDDGSDLLAQSILWEQDLDAVISDGMFTLNAVATSGLPVTYSCSNESVAVVNGNILILLGVGQAIITASQVGNDQYLPAQNVMKILNVSDNPSTPQEQTITWEQNLTASLNDLYLVLTATATSGLPVTYTSSNPSIATVNGSVLLLHGVGQTIITASQPGNDQYMAAPNVMKILNVTAPDGIEEFPTTHCRVWPSPSNGVFHVEWEETGDVNYRVFDIFGKMVQNGEINTSAPYIDLSTCPNGIYFLELVSDKGETTRTKVVKTK